MRIKEKREFDNLASTYDRALFSSNELTSCKRFFKLLSINDILNKNLNLKILELGCGTGIYTKHLITNKNFSVFATDFSNKMIQVAKEKINKKKVFFIQCNAENLPFSDNSFDLVVAFSCMHHIKNTKKVFFEIKRVLNTNKDFLMMEPNPLNPINTILGLSRRIERGMLFSWPKRWIKEAQDAMLKLVKYRSGSFFPGWPLCLNPIYNKAEPILENSPLIKDFMIFYFYHFKK